MSFDDASIETIELEDIPERQDIAVKSSASKAVEIRIVETYGPESAPVALSEIEFFKKP